MLTRIIASGLVLLMLIALTSRKRAESADEPRMTTFEERVANSADRPAACDKETTTLALPAADGRNKFALLVGCTTYPALDQRFHLIGPENDVVLAKELLTGRFGFREEDVVLLADHVGSEDHLPTRNNIEREWRALAHKTGKGDQVLVLMAGHGTQMPQAGDDEADGLDEMFLPRDVGPWNDTVGAVVNGIRDDDIKDWISSVRATGADLWVIIDACHSGTMTRDTGGEVRREVNPEALGVTKEALEKAQVTASDVEDDEQSRLFSGMDSERTRAVGGDTDEPVLIALYASQSIEPTVEKMLPRRGKNRKYFGLLTYTMSEVLSQSESKMTYRELVHRIHRQYIKSGRVSPTPVLEGNGLDREVLGLEFFPDRPRILISGSARRGYQVNAGSLRGITPGSILAVYPPAGEANADEVIGHARVRYAGLKPIEATIEPCEYDGKPAPAKLVSGMRCKLVYSDLGDQRLCVGVDSHTDGNEELSSSAVESLKSSLEDCGEDSKHLVIAVDDPSDADWLLRMNSLESAQLFLTPLSGWHGKQEGKRPPLFGPAPEGRELAGWLATSLNKIAKVQALLRISSGGGAGWGDPTKVTTEIVRFKDASDRTGVPVRFDRGGIKLFNGDQIGFRVTNTGDEALDVTMLFVDSSYGIHCLYPESGATNRLYPGNQLMKRGAITANTTGLEHLIVLAVKGKAVDAPVNFAGLAQASIERTRAVIGPGMETPLGKMLRAGMFGAVGEKTRGFSSAAVETFHTQTISWTTMLGDGP